MIYCPNFTNGITLVAMHLLMRIKMANFQNPNHNRYIHRIIDIKTRRHLNVRDHNRRNDFFHPYTRNTDKPFRKTVKKQT